MLCYNIPIDAFILVKIQERKGIILYYKTNKIIGLTKHMDVNNVVMATKIEKKKKKSLLRGCWKNNQQKKS
jgi:ABC-type antimicrobial peptide transport system ATPase subunit